MPHKTNEGQEPDLSMAEAVRRLGVSEGTLRRWEREGKIAARRTPGNHRRYNAADIEQLRTSPAVEAVKA